MTAFAMVSINTMRFFSIIRNHRTIIKNRCVAFLKVHLFNRATFCDIFFDKTNQKVSRQYAL